MVAFTKDQDRGRWLDLCRVRFAEMLPQIRQEASVALCFVPPHRRRALVDEVVRQAFGTSLKLAERGKMQIAYPEPLAMVRMKHLRAAKDERRRG